MTENSYINHANKATLSMLENIKPYIEIPWDGIEFSSSLPLVTFGAEKCHVIASYNKDKCGLFHVHPNDPVEYYIEKTKENMKLFKAFFIGGMYSDTMPKYYGSRGIEISYVYSDINEFGRLIPKDIIVYPSLEEIAIISGNKIMTKKFIY